MDCRVLLAVRPPEEGKSRLAEALSATERFDLNNNMFRHVISIICQVVPPAALILVSRSEALLEEARVRGAQVLAETGSDLNSALEQAARLAVEQGAGSLLSLSSDLPGLTPDDVRAMIEAPADIAIATDRFRRGTNALRMRPAGVIGFRYGGDSLAAHLAAAREARREALVVDRPGLANDIDTPADLAELRHG